MTWPWKNPGARDSNRGSSALEVDCLTSRPTRRLSVRKALSAETHQSWNALYCCPTPCKHDENKAATWVMSDAKNIRSVTVASSQHCLCCCWCGSAPIALTGVIILLPQHQHRNLCGNSLNCCKSMVRNLCVRELILTFFFSLGWGGEGRATMSTCKPHPYPHPLPPRKHTHTQTCTHTYMHSRTETNRILNFLPDWKKVVVNHQILNISFFMLIYSLLYSEQQKRRKKKTNNVIPRDSNTPV